MEDAADTAALSVSMSRILSWTPLWSGSDPTINVLPVFSTFLGNK